MAVSSGCPGVAVTDETPPGTFIARGSRRLQHDGKVSLVVLF
jgi:hypothetical protein